MALTIFGVEGFSGWTSAMRQSVFANIKRLGAGWVRLEWKWYEIQPTDNSHWDWTKYDAIVAEIAAAGLTPLPILYNTPQWSSGQADVMYPPGDNADFAAFAAACATRYAPLGVHHWEIWNEPNSHVFWKPVSSGTDYAAMMKAAADAIHAADEDSYVIGGSLGRMSTSGGDHSETDFLTEICSVEGALASVDAISTHPYSGSMLPSQSTSTDPVSGWSRIALRATSLVSILTAAGEPDKPIWLTEYGVPTYGTNSPAQSATCWPVPYPQCVTEEFQAQFPEDAVTTARNAGISGNVVALFWFSDTDPGTTPDDKGDWYGLRRVDGTYKPAALAFKAAIA